MMSHKGSPRVCRVLFLLVVFGSLSQTSWADSIFAVTIDTKSLSGVNAQLAFDLIRGDGATNSISILSFSTDGTLGAATSMGGPLNGALPGPITLGDTDFFNELLQSVTLGDTISFTLSLSQNFAGPTPAEFALFMLDASTGLPLFSSADPTGADALLVVDITGTVFGQYSVFQANGSGPAVALTVTPITTPPPPTPAPVPEPTSVLLFGTGISALLLGRAWKRAERK